MTRLRLFALLFVLAAALVVALPVGGDATAAAALRPNATSVCGDPLQVLWSTRLSSSVVATPRIVDLLHDGRREILAPVFTRALEAVDGTHGGDVRGFPFLHPRLKVYGSPLPVDIDADGRTEWLIALQAGLLLIVSEDGAARGVVRVPPLSVKRDWRARNLTLGEAAVMRAAPPNATRDRRAEVLRARRLVDLTFPTLEEMRIAAEERRARRLAQARLRPAQWRDIDTNDDDDDYDDYDDYDNYDDDDDAQTWNWDALTGEEHLGGAAQEKVIGPDAHLSAEARRSMELLFHMPLYRTAFADGAVPDLLASEHLRGHIDVLVAPDEVALDAHLLSTPVVTDIDGNGDLDVLLHVSYYFDAADYAPLSPGGRPLPEGVRPDDYAATALVCLNLVTGGVQWVRVLQLTAKDDATPAYALSTPVVVNADEDAGLEIYVTSSTGALHALSGRGRPLPGWPVWLGPMTASPAAEDVSGDGRLDICAGDLEGTVACYNATGGLLWRSAVVGGLADRVSFGDMDGDGVVDVVLGTTEGLLYALRGRDGSVLPHFPVVTQGPIIAPPLLVNLRSEALARGLHAVVPSHDGHLYVVDGVHGCLEAVDLDERSSTMVLAGDVAGTGHLNLVVTTLHGGVFVFDTTEPFHPLKAWPSKTKGLNGCTASENHVGVFFAEPFRSVGEVRGDRFHAHIEIRDARPSPARRRYTIDIYAGTRVRLYHGVHNVPKAYTLSLHAPLERTYTDLQVVLTLPNGQTYTDTIAIAFNMHVLESVKYSMLLPFLVGATALMLVHKRHEVELADTLDDGFVL